LIVGGDRVSASRRNAICIWEVRISFLRVVGGVGGAELRGALGARRRLQILKKLLVAALEKLTKAAVPLAAAAKHAALNGVSVLSVSGVRGYN
jgi:hypothetical protein